MDDSDNEFLPITALSPGLRSSASTVPWINDPIQFANDFSFRSFGKFPTSIVTQLTPSPAVFEHKVMIDATSGLVGTGLGKSKDEAERAAYLSLCQIISSNAATSLPISKSGSAEICHSEDDVDKDKVWFNGPKVYLHKISLEKFGRPVSYEVTFCNPLHHAKAEIDKSLGLVSIAESMTKKEASRMSAVLLCRLVDEWVATNPDYIRIIPEYEHYLSKDIPDSKNHPWYHNAKLEVSKISMKLTGKEPLYLTSVADLDPSTHLCQVVVDEEKGLVGYGRSSKIKEAARLAAVDLCLRHKMPKAIGLKSEIDIAKDEAKSEAVPFPSVVSVPQSPMKKLEISDDMAVNERSAVNLSCNVLEHSAKRPKLIPSSSDHGITLEISAGYHGQSSAISKALSESNRIEEIVTETIRSLKPVEEKPLVHAEPVSHLHVKAELVSTSPLNVEPVSSSPVRAEPVSQAPVPYEPLSRPPLRFELLPKQPVTDVSLPNSTAIKPSSSPSKNTSGAAPLEANLNLGENMRFHAALNRFSPSLVPEFSQLFQRLKIKGASCIFWREELVWRCRFEFTIHGVKYTLESQKGILKKKAAFESALGNLNIFIKGQLQDFMTAKPLPRSNSSKSELQSVEKPLSFSSKPVIPSADQDYMMVNLPDLSVSSLKKWIQDPRNYDRLLQIQQENIGRTSFSSTITTSNEMLNVNAEDLEKSSRVLLDDLYAFRSSEMGAQMLAYRDCLPISPYKDEILSHISGSQVVIVSGEAGLGKSTQIPNYVFEQMTLGGFGSQCNIIFVVSDAWCGVGLAKRIAQERGEAFGDRVGFGFEGEYSPKERFGSITVCALTEFIAKLSKNPDLYGYSHVIIDDLEDGKVILDVALYKMRKLLQQRLELRLILFTPLVDTLVFAEYFQTFSLSCLPLAPFEMNVNQVFLEDLVPILNPSLLNARDSVSFIRDEMKFGELVRQEESSPVIDMVDPSSMPFSLIEATLGYICSTTPANEPVLVFLPGHDEITTLHRYLLQDDFLKAGYKNPEVYEFVFIHESLNNLNNASIFGRTNGPVRKIILSDQLSECKIPTVDVVHVIDACKYKPSLKEAVTSEPFIPYKWISQVECIRRSRCCGREAGFGVYYCLMSMSRFGFLPEKPSPQIARFQLTLSVLQVRLLLPLDDLKDILANLVNTISQDRLDSCLDEMRKMKLLTFLHDRLTSIGRHLYNLELPVRLGKMVFTGIFLRCLDPAIVMAAALICGNPVLKDGLKNATFSFKTECSDHMCLLEVFKMWAEAKTSFVRKSDEIKFCEMHNLSHSTLMMMTKVVGFIRNVITSSGILVSAADSFNRIIGSQNRKENNLEFFNENSKKQSLIKGLCLVGLYPELGVSKPDSWRMVSLINKKETVVIQNTLANWDPMEHIHNYRDATEKLCFGISSFCDGTKLASVASPLAMVLFMSSFIGSHLMSTIELPRKFSFDSSLFFGYRFEESEFAVRSFKTALESCLLWFADKTANHPFKLPNASFSDEEISRVVDNIIRTSVSLLETEEF